MNKWIQQEQEILDKTVDRLERGRYRVVSGADVDVDKISSQSATDGSVQIYHEEGNQASNLKLAIEEPFFGRIDIEEDRKREVLYIGKRGIKDQSEDVMVVDWRRPIASVYYNFTSGLPRQTYKVITPSGEVRKDVEVLKKRQFTIEEQKIKSIQQEGPDTKSDLNRIITHEGSVKSDATTVLHNELEKSSTNGHLKEIIATIQTEQNAAIRKPLERNVIIQGVAGSGKSSIALHRMSYLLYNHELKPEDMLIIAPSELFLSSIQNLLPNLELKGIKQATFERLARESLKSIGINLSSKSLTDFFEDKLYQDAADDDYLYAKLRSSEQMVKWIDEYVQTVKDQTSTSLKPFSWKGHEISLEEMNTLFKGYTYLPVDRQLKSFLVAMEKRFADIYTKEKKEIDREANAIRTNYLTGHDLSTNDFEQLVRLLANMQESKQRVLSRTFQRAVEDWKKSIVQTNLLELYQAMWNQIQLVYSSDEQMNRLLLVNQTKLDYFDTAPLFYLAIQLGHQFPTYSHIVVDEAQDLSDVQLRCLQALTKTMTIIGDTNQSLLMDCGQMNWDHVKTSIYQRENVDFVNLTKSYRSTAEIIEVAKSILATQFPKESKELQSVNRNGAPVIWKQVESAKGLVDHMVDTITAWRERHNRICIIAKDGERAVNLLRVIRSTFSDVKLVTNFDKVEGEGIFVMAAHEVKGMEFDAIYLMNVNASNYPNTKFHAKLLYTLVTRAQQELAISYFETPSPFIESFTSGEGKQLEMFEGIL